VSASLSGEEFSRLLQFRYTDVQEPSYASGPRGGGTYAQPHGWKTVSVYFGDELIFKSRMTDSAEGDAAEVAER
jgi:hypothetical protein